MNLEEFEKVCLENGLRVTGYEIEKLNRYVKLLMEWNRKVNLISRRELDIWRNHILHSISPLFILDIDQRGKILDLGTGGGLPGIPWAVLLPNVDFILLDGTKKKINAVKDIISKIGLKNVTPVWGRAEVMCKRREFKGKFNYVICRAVGDLKKVAKWSFPLLGKNSDKFLEKGEKKYYLHRGTLIAFKGGDIDDEIKSAGRLKFVAEIKVLDLKFLESKEIDLKDKKIVLVKFKNK
jgi:16S rRNA (guanine527-N7)-methyltransferase